MRSKPKYVRLPYLGLPVEILEARVMLTAAGSGLSAAQLAPLYATGQAELHGGKTHVASVKQGAMGRLTNDLSYLYDKAASGSAVTAQDLLAIQSSNGNPGVLIHWKGAAPRLLHKLEKLGLRLVSDNGNDHIVEGYIPPAELLKAAKLPHVASITALDKPILRTQGVAANQADQTMRDDLRGATYGLDGSGVKIGVISDSVSQSGGGINDSIRTGDLPANVNILQDAQLGGTDEGLRHA